MKIKYFLLLLIFFISSHVNAEILTGNVEFNWDKLTQSERDNDIENIKNKIFSDNIIYKFDKQVFNVEYNNFKKDDNYVSNYMNAKSNKFDAEDKIIVPFYLKKVLLAYGLIYKSDLAHCYYYDAMGHLFIVEMFEHDYNKYPVPSYQYDKNGKLQYLVYALNKYDDYMYDVKGNFVGRCYRENCYNKSGKIKITRFIPD